MTIDLTSASANELNKAIQRMADASGETVKDTLTKHARLLCVDFAANTRPLEKGKGGKQKGEDNIKKKILSIYVSKAVAWELLETHKKGYGGTFYAMIKKGDLAQAAQFLKKYSRKSFEVGNFDGGALHRQLAFKGRTTKRMVVLDFPEVNRYVALIQKRVGYAKGGFASAARQLGGTRGIPGFATRHPAPGQGRVEGDGKSLTVTVENRVKYARLALTPEKEAAALDFRRRQIDTVLTVMMNRAIGRAIR